MTPMHLNQAAKIDFLVKDTNSPGKSEKQSKMGMVYLNMPDS